MDGSVKIGWVDVQMDGYVGLWNGGSVRFGRVNVEMDGLSSLIDASRHDTLRDLPLEADAHAQFLLQGMIIKQYQQR
ncbi:hypothetical protein PoB_002885500 [Plakobranchus ocellatus]|uniref:Uncharacterized protein n=1 Tax=Plakobranchus ocellatus TaxID=259542 RepID=A0AAV4A2G5_9GAST|nr:hypothetical protein PoB_002885500 [Plakobranchus ocellatus]